MDSSENSVRDATPGKTTLDRAIDTYLSDKRTGDDDRPGRYYRHAKSVLGRWTDWLETQRGVESVDALETTDLRRWARSLRDSDLAAASAGNYFAVVRAFCSWCVREGLIEVNPADPDRASEPLSGADGIDPDRQFWSTEAREELVKWVRGRVSSAYERPMLPPSERRQRVREYAIVAVLAYSGARGAELFRSVDDARRDGVTWDDVDLDNEILEVLGKSGKREEVPLPGPAADAVGMYRHELTAAVDDELPEEWPVFPTRHRPSLYAAVREHLTDRSIDAEALLETNDVEVVAAEYAIPVPAVTIEGARRVMERICGGAEVAIDGEYLKPHGGRRQLGDEVYREDPALAQQLLRHRNIETTKKSYSYIETSEVGDVVEDVVDRE
jgi:integrase